MRKPNLRGKVARTALSAVLAGAMAVSGVVGPVGTALGAAKFTLYGKNSEVDTTTKYYAYRVFNAGDVDPSTYVATDVTWASDAVRTAVVNYIANNGFTAWLNERGLTGDGAGTNPSYALNFISDKIAEDRANGSSYAHANSGNLDIANYTANITTSDSFASGLALAIATANYNFSKADAKSTMTKVEVSANLTEVTPKLYEAATSGGTITLTGVDDGYYVLAPDLYYTKDDSGKVVTSFEDQAPIWVPFTGSDLRIAVKDYLGTITKLVLDDATGSVFGSVADAAKGQYLDYQITVTMPDKVASGSTINVIDEMPQGMNLKTDSVKVKAGSAAAESLSETDTGKGFSISGSTITFRLSAASGVEGLNKGDSIVLTYQAALNESASTGLTSYNTNKASLQYVIGSESGTTVASNTNVTAYQLALNLIDSKTGNPVAGTNAKFTIRDETGQYITAGGERGGTTPIELSLGTSSTLSIPYIDEGSFIVTQTAAPDGYELTSANVNTIKVTATKELGKVTSLQASVGEDGNAKLVSITEGSGLISVNIPNLQTETIVLPITGMTPSQLGTIVGALLIVGGGAVIIMRRRNSNAAA